MGKDAPRSASGKTLQSQLNASRKYQDSKKRICMYLEPETYEKTQAAAAARGVSMTRYIIELIEQDAKKNTAAGDRDTPPELPFEQ